MGQRNKRVNEWKHKRWRCKERKKERRTTITTTTNMTNERKAIQKIWSHVLCFFEKGEKAKNSIEANKVIGHSSW